MAPAHRRSASMRTETTISWAPTVCQALPSDLESSQLPAGSGFWPRATQLVSGGAGIRALQDSALLSWGGRHQWPRTRPVTQRKSPVPQCGGRKPEVEMSAGLVPSGDSEAGPSSPPPGRAVSGVSWRVDALLRSLPLSPQRPALSSVALFLSLLGTLVTGRKATWVTQDDVPSRCLT